MVHDATGEDILQPLFHGVADKFAAIHRRKDLFPFFQGLDDVLQRGIGPPLDMKAE